MNLDLNARRAARAAARSEGKQVVLGTRAYDLVDELPISVMELIGDNDLTAAVKLILKNPETDWQSFAPQCTFEDVIDIVQEYGASLGESSASTPSSPPTGASSGPTSAATTDWTSVGLSTAPEPML
jgi:hypothetical protein